MHEMFSSLREIESLNGSSLAGIICGWQDGVESGRWSAGCCDRMSSVFTVSPH